MAGSVSYSIGGGLDDDLSFDVDDDFDLKPSESGTALFDMPEERRVAKACRPRGSPSH